jgi:hypothetical protein
MILSIEILNSFRQIGEFIFFAIRTGDDLVEQENPVINDDTLLGPFRFEIEPLLAAFNLESKVIPSLIDRHILRFEIEELLDFSSVLDGKLEIFKLDLKSLPLGIFIITEEKQLKKLSYSIKKNPDF